MRNLWDGRPDTVDREALARMTRVLHHRGPDDDGFYVHEYEDGLGVGLGFRRLWIIDLGSHAKKGFGIPVIEWFKKELRNPLQDELSPARLRQQGLFESFAVQGMIAEHMRRRRDQRKQFWTLFVFQLWHRRRVER